MLLSYEAEVKQKRWEEEEKEKEKTGLMGGRGTGRTARRGARHEKKQRQSHSLPTLKPANHVRKPFLLLPGAQRLCGLRA